jgi:hypothetical protein
MKKVEIPTQAYEGAQKSHLEDSSTRLLIAALKRKNERLLQSTKKPQASVSVLEPQFAKGTHLWSRETKRRYVF